jgi:apolipoprotein N-acyltransferase
MKKHRDSLFNFALALLSALLLILVFPNLIFAESGQTWLAPLALTPLLIALSREHRPLWRFLLGEFAGIVYWFGVCSWIQFVLEYHGGMGRWGGWAVFLLFSIAKALHMAVFSSLAGVVVNTPYAIPAVAALWTGIERTHGNFGFAWLALGNAGIDMPLAARLAPFFGVYAISFVFTLTAATVAMIILRRGRGQLLWLALVPVLLVLPELPPPHAPLETAIVLQPNMPEEAQWTLTSAGQARDRLIELSLEAAMRAKPQLVIWPEVPGPLYYYRDQRFHEEATDLARVTHAHFLFGTVADTREGAPLNSAVLLRADGSLVDRYDKINLVPFGEYVPKFFGFVNRITQEAGDFSPGERMVVFPLDDHKLGTFICYESVFPSQVREFVRGGANLLVNLSNDGYFGHSAAREQHLEIARMRAVENRRWLLRSTNDGITAAIDPAGRVVQRLPMYREAIARMGFNYVDGTTFYTEHGDWFAWSCLLASCVTLFCSQRPHYTAHKK